MDLQATFNLTLFRVAAERWVGPTKPQVFHASVLASNREGQSQGDRQLEGLATESQGQSGGLSTIPTM